MADVMKKTLNKGFTLIELLLVIAVIVALAVTVFVALNPATRLLNARDARRTTDVDSILNATQEYIIDHAGVIPAGISTTDTMIGTCVTSTQGFASGGCNVATGSACFNPTSLYAPYLQSLPMDPGNVSSSPVTDYAISVVASSGIITVKACSVEKAGGQIWESR